MSSNRYEIAKEYWRNQVAGYSHSLELMADSPKSALYQKGIHTFTLPEPDYQKISKITKGNSLAVFVVLLECFYITLYKLTGEQDIAISTPVLNKIESEGNDWVLFRSHINGSFSVEEMLYAVKQSVREGYLHQYYPIEKALREEGLDDPELACRFTFRIEGLHCCDPLDSDLKKDFVLTAKQEQGYIELEVSYDAGRYLPQTVEAIFTCYSTILTEMLHDPNRLIRDINLVGQEEENKLLNEFNQTKKDYPLVRVEALFEEQVAKTPDKIALHYVSFTSNEERTITYRELNQKANRLAKKMRESGVRTGDIVGIYGDRTIENVLSKLAVLKAGGCFLSVNPSLPDERLRYMINDSALKLIVLCKPLPHELGYVGPVLDVSRVEEIEGLSEAPRHNAGVMDPAYVIYTSGTTGKPKGVLIEHRSMVNLVYCRVSPYHFNEKDVVLQIPSFSFDCSIADIFTPLVSGGSIVLLDEENRLNVSYIKQALTDYSITHMFNTPSFYRVMLREIGEGLKGLRVVTIAGEDYSSDLVEEHQRLIPNVRLVAEYGPTETTVYCSMHEYRNREKKVLIGRPTSNVQCFVLNHEHKLLPIGISGELYISGDCLARGYLNKEELTEQLFIPNPYLISQRMYKSGDRVKWHANGNMEFLGRVDDQVKIRGIRIELGEIEATIGEIPTVKEKAVVVKEDKQGDKYLAAYFVAEEEVEATEVRAYLQQKLPYYSVPTVVRKINSFNLNVNGKLDKKTLLTIEDEEEIEIVPPQNETEEQLVVMWVEVLNLRPDQISVVENFFDLGGNSLKSIILIDKIKKSLGHSIALQAFLEMSSIRNIYNYIQESKR